MFLMRPATIADGPAVLRLILDRCTWLEDRGLPSWRANAEELAALSENTFGDEWVLERQGRVVGRTTVQTHMPPWGWTDTERTESTHYLTTSITDPAFRAAQPGALMALWAVDRAAHEGVEWVRRDCLWPGLVRYYLAQGFTVVREIERPRYTLHLMQRRAEKLLDLEDAFRTGTPLSPGADRSTG